VWMGALQLVNSDRGPSMIIRPELERSVPVHAVPEDRSDGLRAFYGLSPGMACETAVPAVEHDDPFRGGILSRTHYREEAVQLSRLGLGEERDERLPSAAGGGLEAARGDLHAGVSTLLSR